MSKLSDLAVTVAIDEIGNEEIPIGSNWGVHVQTYLASVKISFPASWCMAYVYWCFNIAAKQLNVPNPLVKTGGVLNQWNKVDALYKSKIAKVGSIFIMDFGHGLGHTGIVERIEGEILHTIEGNTNDTGSREGYEVCRRTRNKSKCIGFISV